MQAQVEEIKKLLEVQFQKTVRISVDKTHITDFKVNTPYLVNTDIELLQSLAETRGCSVEVKRSGTGLVILVTY